MIEQSLADWYISINKKKVSEQVHDLAASPKLSIELRSPQVPTEEFILDIHKHTIKLSKFTFHARVRKAIGLVRIDFDGPPHMNPDSTIIKCPHIHIYKEGFDLKWAYPLPHMSNGRKFIDQGNLIKNLDHFFSYCNIIEPPLIQIGLL